MTSLLIGLTGGISSGKTAVSDYLASLGAYVIDTDLLAREVVAKDSQGLAEICQKFGEYMLTPAGELNRTALRELVFSDNKARETLNAITHPKIESLAKQRIAEKPSSAHYTVMVIPLLVETVAQTRYGLDRILVVDIPVELQVSRLMQRDNIDEQRALAIIKTQASREQRLAVANEVLRNDGSLAKLQEQTRVIDEKYKQIAAFIE
jgi:dephospho-CoA kinase